VTGDARIILTRTRTKDQQARRTRLIEAARELAGEGGYAAVTMHDVADRAGVARATVYRYFTSKDHLLTDVASVWARTVTPDVAAMTYGGTPVERLGTLLERIVELAAAELRLTSAIVQAVTSDDPGVEESRMALFLLVRERLATAIGEPGPGQADVEMVLGHILLSALVSLTALARPAVEVRAMVRTAARLILRGV
jgi:AcrR family transcriptional regulator